MENDGLEEEMCGFWLKRLKNDQGEEGSVSRKRGQLLISIQSRRNAK
jgi:hypothetical protein